MNKGIFNQIFLRFHLPEAICRALESRMMIRLHDKQRQARERRKASSGMFARWLHPKSNESLRKILTKTNKLTKELFTVFRLLCLASSFCTRKILHSLSKSVGFLVALSTLFVLLGFCATHKQNTYSGFMSFFSFCLSSLWLFTVNFNLTATSDLAFFEILSGPGFEFYFGFFYSTQIIFAQAKLNSPCTSLQSRKTFLGS